MHSPFPKPIARQIADVMIDRASRGCTLDDIRDETNLSLDEINAHLADAEKLARGEFVRQAHADATDELAREDVEGGERNILVSIPVMDICQVWQALRGESAPVEATLRLKHAFSEARA